MRREGEERRNRGGREKGKREWEDGREEERWLTSSVLSSKFS
jgi:hypothetical protein